MDQTAIWMLGVVGFGLIFYGCAFYYAKWGDKEEK